MRLQKRLAMLIMFPPLAILWLIGWTLYYTGSKKNSHSHKKRLSTSKELKFAVLIPEEKYAK